MEKRELSKTLSTLAMDEIRRLEAEVKKQKAIAELNRLSCHREIDRRMLAESKLEAFVAEFVDLCIDDDDDDDAMAQF